MKKKDKASKEFKKYEGEILAMRKEISQWNLDDLTSEELHELGSILQRMQQRFKGKQVEWMAKKERALALKPGEPVT
jgi:hypothetical protein